MVFVLTGNDIPAEACGRLVDVSKIPDAVSGAALVIEVKIPDGASCQYVKVVAIAAVASWRALLR